MKKSVRTTISIPAALKARMDAAGEEINWSSVAAQAFEAKLAEIISRRGAKDMKDVISRLKASKAKSNTELDREARTKGRDWAMNRAEAVWLQRLAEARASDSDWEWGAMFNTDLNSPHQVAYRIMTKTVEGEAERDEIDEFWKSAFGEAYEQFGDDAGFIEGFLAAAIALWHEVKNDL